MALALLVSICRQRTSKSDYSQSSIKHKLPLMDVDDFVMAMLSAIKVSQGIMISRNPEYLALKYIMQLCEDVFGMVHHFLLIMRGGLMIAVGNISPNQTIIEPVAAVLYLEGQPVNVIEVEMQIRNDDDVKFLALQFQT